MCFMLYLEVWVLLSSRFLKIWFWNLFEILQVRFCLSLSLSSFVSFFLSFFYGAYCAQYPCFCLSTELPRLVRKILIFRQLPLVNFHVGSSLNDLTVCKQRFPSSCWLPLLTFLLTWLPLLSFLLTFDP